jgi:tetratricopeptide (TPR) repeat protein
MANSDKDCSTDYFYADYLFRAGKYQESLDKAKAMASGACSNYPRLKVLFAYDYDRLGDSTQARSNIESYLTGVTPEKAATDPNIGSDYLFGASVLKKFPGGEETAINYLKNALNLDTVRTRRFQYMDTIAYLYKRQGKMPERLDWLLQSFKTNPNPSNLDIYNIADAAINAGNFPLADSMARVYISKYPDQEYGYALLVRGAKAADSTTGASFGPVQEYIDFLAKQDATKNANKIKAQYYYMASIAADKMKDYPKALDIVNRIIAIDPADAFATQAKPVLEKAVNGKSATGSGSAPAKKATAPAKPAAKKSK